MDFVDSIFRAAPRRPRRWPKNFALTALNIIVLGAIPVTGLVVADVAHATDMGVLNWLAVTPLAALIIGLLFRSLVSWAIHLAMHQVPSFWVVFIGFTKRIRCSNASNRMRWVSRPLRPMNCITVPTNSRYSEVHIAALREILAPLEIVPFGFGDISIAGKIRAELERQGITIGPYNIQISAQAVAWELILVTNNVREFARVEGLSIEDWS